MEESIKLQDFDSQEQIDTAFMHLALEEAIAAYLEGEVPVGAVIVYEGRVIAKAHNLVEQDDNAMRHAEILVMEEAAKQLGWRLYGCTLYVTLEPCAMCAGAMVNSRVSRIVYATPDPERGCCGSLINLVDDKSFVHRLQVSEGILHLEASELLRRFFQERRRKNVNS